MMYDTADAWNEERVFHGYDAADRAHTWAQSRAEQMVDGVSYTRYSYTVTGSSESAKASIFWVRVPDGVVVETEKP